jgi:predicted porin
MKKTLVALAAASAVSAFAQVTLSGNLDMAYQNISNQATAESAKYLKGNGSSTSAIFFKGEEDLGAGTKAIFLLEMDPTLHKSDLSNEDSATSANYYRGSPFNGEQFVGATGNFGMVKLGIPNSAVGDVNGVAQPLGTAVGSGYSSSGFGRNGVTGKYAVLGYVGAEASNRVIRHERTVRYDTPVMSGFSASYEWSGGNANRTASNKQQSNTNEWTALGLKYSNGPLNASWASGKAASVGSGVAAGLNNNTGTVTIASTGTATGTTATNVDNNLAANTSVTHTYLAANYALSPNLTVYGGMTSTKTSGITVAAAAGEDMTSTNVAVKYVMGQFDLMANYVSAKDKAARTTPLDGKLLGLGLNYNLSKRTMTYVRYENYDVSLNDSTAGVKKTTAIGIRHQF